MYISLPNILQRLGKKKNWCFHWLWAMNCRAIYIATKGKYTIKLIEHIMLYLQDMINLMDSNYGFACKGNNTSINIKAVEF